MINLPGDPQDNIFEYLDRPTLACLARTCRCLRLPAETILFRHIKINLWDDRAFLGRSGILSSSLSKALTCHPRDLDIRFTPWYRQDPDRDELLEYARLLTILRACAPERMRALTVIFSKDAKPSPHLPDYLQIASSKRFAFQKLAFEESSWASLEPFVI